MWWFSYLVMRGVVWVRRLLFADINIPFSTALHRSKARLGSFFPPSSSSLFLFSALFVNLFCCLSHYSIFPSMRHFFSSRNSVCCNDILGPARRTFLEMGIVFF